MKKSGIINAQLAGALARLGHTDLLVVCDSGFPVPSGPEIVDLAFRFGVPPFETVLEGLLEELIFEGATVASEVRDASPEVLDMMERKLPELGLIEHRDLKRMSTNAKLVVRTGEATPFSNVILQCGVPY